MSNYNLPFYCFIINFFLFLIGLQLPQHNIVANYNPQLCCGNGKDKNNNNNNNNNKKQQNDEL